MLFFFHTYRYTIYISRGIMQFSKKIKVLKCTKYNIEMKNKRNTIKNWHLRMINKTQKMHEMPWQKNDNKRLKTKKKRNGFICCGVMSNLWHSKPNKHQF